MSAIIVAASKLLVAQRKILSGLKVPKIRRYMRHREILVMEMENWYIKRSAYKVLKKDDMVSKGISF